MTLTAFVDLAIAITLLEAVAVFAWWKVTGEGPEPRAWMPNLAAGILLMVALRLASVDAPLAWILPCLTASGVAHAVDLARRWPRRRAARRARVAAAG
jgi:hypothetical protein